MVALPPAIFVFAHPDDETLAAGVAVAEHVAAGQDVHILLLTDGTASSVINSLNGSGLPAWWGVQHDPIRDGYEPLTSETFGQARLAEAATAAHSLSQALPGTLTMHRAGLPDGAVTIAAASAAIVDLADELAPGASVRVKTHSYLVDNHPDHLNAGKAAQQLSRSSARFADRRHYVLPTYWADSRLSQVMTSWDTPTNGAISVRVRNACRAYGAWAPPHSFAIGHHSVHALFDQIAASPRCLVHQ